MISRVFSPEIETREPGTFRYLILYRKSVEGGGEQEPVLITDISPPHSPVPCPFHLREPPTALVVHFTSSSSLFPIALLIPVFSSLEIHTHVYARARTPSRRSISDLGTETSRGFPPPRDTTLSLCRRRFSGRNWNVGINVSQLEIQHVAEITDEECHGAFGATAI